MLLLLGPHAAGATTVTHGLATATAPAENTCLHATLSSNGDDCSYNASGTGASQWIGPTFSAGFYAPGFAPAVYANPAVPSPVTAPARVLTDDVANGIVMRGIPAGVTLTIDDNGTPADPTDDLIAGNVALVGFERNFETSAGKRAIESFGYLQFFLTSKKVDAATPNATGGYDYVLGSKGMPELLAGATTAGGGYADAFPSLVASQSTASALDVPYWTCPSGSATPLPGCIPNIGIATFEGNVGATMNQAFTVGAAFDCKADPTVNSGTCTTGPTAWDGPLHATPRNVLLRVSTAASGAITGGRMILVKEFNAADDDTKPADSWSATTIDLTGDATLHVADDDLVFTKYPGSGNTPPYTYKLNALANDTFATTGTNAVLVTATPAHGTVTVNGANFDYKPDAGAYPPDTFDYSVIDTFGQTATATVTVRGIAAYNDGTTPDTALTTDGGVAITFPVLPNDAIRASTPVTVTIDTQPPGGTATVNPDNTITYTPGLNFKGCDAYLVPSCKAYSGNPDSLVYQVADGEGHKSKATAFVNVVPLIIAVDDGTTAGSALTTASGVPITMTVLPNDIVRTTDGSPLTVTIVTQPRGGTATVNADNTITYAPAIDFQGCSPALVVACRSALQPDVIRYKVADTHGHEAEANVYVNVFPNAERSSGSAMDPAWLAVTGAFGLLRRRRIPHS